MAAFLIALGFPEGKPDNDYWRIEFAIPIVTNVLRIILFLFVFKREPPSYYISKG